MVCSAVGAGCAGVCGRVSFHCFHAWVKHGSHVVCGWCGCGWVDRFCCLFGRGPVGVGPGLARCWVLRRHLWVLLGSASGLVA